MGLKAEYVVKNSINTDIYKEGNILNIIFYDKKTNSNLTKTGRISEISVNSFVLNCSGMYDSEDIYVVEFKYVISAAISSEDVNGLPSGLTYKPFYLDRL